MQQTGAYFNAIYKHILHLSKISAMFWITIHPFRYVDKTWNTREFKIKSVNIFDDMQSHTLVKKCFIFMMIGNTYKRSFSGEL